jgi:hypothetical protein
MFADQVDPPRSAGNQRGFLVKLFPVRLCCALLNLPH